MTHPLILGPKNVDVKPLVTVEEAPSLWFKKETFPVVIDAKGTARVVEEEGQ